MTNLNNDICELNLNELDAVSGGCECPNLNSVTPDTGKGSGLFWGIAGGLGSALAAGSGAVKLAGESGLYSRRQHAVHDFLAVWLSRHILITR
jgi:hypothetical protein